MRNSVCLNLFVYVCVCVVFIMSFASIYKNDFVDPKEFELCWAEWVRCSTEASTADNGGHSMDSYLEPQNVNSDCCSDALNRNASGNYAHILSDVAKIGTSDLHKILNKDRMRSVYQIEYRRKTAYPMLRTQRNNTHGMDRVGPLLKMCPVGRPMSKVRQPNALHQELPISGRDRCTSSGNNHQLMYGLLKAIEAVKSK